MFPKLPSRALPKTLDLHVRILVLDLKGLEHVNPELGFLILDFEGLWVVLRGIDEGLSLMLGGCDVIKAMRLI